MKKMKCAYTLNSKTKASPILTPKNRRNLRKCNFVKNDRKEMFKKEMFILKLEISRFKIDNSLNDLLIVYEATRIQMRMRYNLDIFYKFYKALRREIKIACKCNLQHSKA